MQGLTVCYQIVARGQLNGLQQINRANFFLKIEIFSKKYCLSIFEPMIFLRLGIGLLDSL